MKKLSELKFEELTLDQKLGMVHAAMIKVDFTDEQKEFVFEQIRNRSLGAVWIQQSVEGAEELIAKVKEIADYPIPIFTDCESGIKEYTTGHHNPISCTGDEKYAYAFGRAVGATARKMGYNIVCNPLLDVSIVGSQRSYGSDKHTVAKMAAAEARGLHDSGVLTVGKHYPSALNLFDIDSHMAESISTQTEEELVDYSLYAYLELIKEDLLDGIMVGHEFIEKIDPNYPASLSKPIMDIIRKRGFNGFYISDALEMMGILNKFGKIDSKGLAVEAGIDFALPYIHRPSDTQKAIKECYEKGIITDERLDEAVKRVLATHHKVMELYNNDYAELTEEEIDLCKRINKDSVYATADEGLSHTISKDGKHLFVVMVRNEEHVNNGQVPEDTFSNGWLYPTRVTKKILELFPNSKVDVFHQFPTQHQNWRIMHDHVDFDDVVFVTFSEFLAYTGRENIPERTVVLIEALQYTNRICALVHFGNPCVLKTLPHIPRVILGGTDEQIVNTALEVLAGDYEAKGVKTYDFKLN